MVRNGAAALAAPPRVPAAAPAAARCPSRTSETPSTAYVSRELGAVGLLVVLEQRARRPGTPRSRRRSRRSRRRRAASRRSAPCRSRTGAPSRPGAAARRSEVSRKIWFSVSAQECAASASIALDSVMTPAAVFAIAMARLALNASRPFPCSPTPWRAPLPPANLRTHGRGGGAGRVEPRPPVVRRRRTRRADRPARRRRHDQRPRRPRAARHVGVRGADRRRPGRRARRPGRPDPRARRRRQRRADRPDARARPGDLRPGVQRHRQPHPVVHRPPALRHREGAHLRPRLGRRLVGVRAVLRELRAGACRRRGARRQGADPGLPPGARPRGCFATCAPTCASRTSRTRRGPSPDYFRMLPDAVGAADPARHARRRPAGLSLPAVGRCVPRAAARPCSARRSPATRSTSRAGRRPSRCSRSASTVRGCAGAPRPPTSRAGWSC